jgi:hypothetical protein
VNSSAATFQEQASPVLLLTLEVPNFLSKSKVKGVTVEKLLPIVPSWNAILGMEHWGRDKFKKEIQHAFLSALRASAADSSTKTTSAKNTLSIAADTLEFYMKTAQERRTSKQRSARLEKKKLSEPLSKSSPLPKPAVEIEPPPF